MMSSKKLCMLICLVPCLIQCSGSIHRAPVTQAHAFSQKPHIAIVRPGDNLYAIALLHDRDVDSLIKINHLKPPYTLKIGQRLRLNPWHRASNKRNVDKRRNLTAKSRYLAAKKRKVDKKRQAHNKARSHWRPTKAAHTPPRSQIHITKASEPSLGRWRWPLNGQVVNRFAPWQQRKGIDITGKNDKTVRASQGGTVVYSGHGLPGYGELIIIKHSQNWLTAYANLNKRLVFEKDHISTGEKIAEMSLTKRGQAMLHFEMRKRGHPVNPLKYLPKRVPG